MQGRVDEAVALYRRAIEASPANAEAQSNLLHALHYLDGDGNDGGDPGAHDRTIADEHARWARSLEPDIGSLPPASPHGNVRDPNRRLHIGYVSGDLREHAIAFFLEPILAHHDHTRFEIACYSNTPAADHVTERLKRHADRWRDIVGLGDGAAAEMIRRDEIDLLIDLSVHTGGNRLGVFARKPAPIQLTYLGYPAAVGLSTIDYRITDAHLDPAGGAHRESDQLLRLSHSYFCYQPPADAPPVAPPPAREAGHVTFGSLNRLAKITPRVVATWSALLSATPRSKLMLMASGLNEAATAAQVTGRFERQGVSSARLELVAPGNFAAYLAALHRIDVSLDPFPFNGATTTLHALWMGVPVVTLAGERAVGRMGLSILSNLALTDLVARSPEQYVAIAGGLASSPERLAALRATMRRRMSDSAILRGVEFTRDLESLYRAAWQTYCLT
jgi:predicted O-linked N-acetylglucosamine transferase (SPINDLY family)